VRRRREGEGRTQYSQDRLFADNVQQEATRSVPVSTAIVMIM
jgi:hypothetical protein